MPAVVPRRRRKPELRKPHWIGERAFPRFLRFREILRRKIDPKALTQQELNSLALLDFARKKHSDAYPTKPEFPAWKPRFPATPTIRLQLPGFEHIELLMKDESLNPTGTHKDRMAWLLKHKRLIPKGARVLIVNTGRGAIA